MVVRGDWLFLVSDRVEGEFFCFLPSSFAVACVGGERDLIVAGMCMVLGDGFLCEGFGTDGYVIFFFLCVGDRLLWMLLCAVGVHGITGDAGLASYDMVLDVWRGYGGFGYQLDEKPDWFFVPTLVVQLSSGVRRRPVS
jgi:hypothetical protein